MTGSLQIKNNIYQAVFSYQDSNGKRKTLWRSTGISAERGNKRKAEKRLLELQNEITTEFEKMPSESTDISFDDFTKIWVDTVRNQVSEITYEGYKQYLRCHIVPYFSGYKLCKITFRDVEKYYTDKINSGRTDGKGGLSYQSVKRHSTVLNMIFNEAIRRQLIKANPCQLARIPKTQTTFRHNFYTVDQCTALLKATEGTVLHDMIYITFIYGLRRSEMMGLRWSDVDFKNDTVTIRHTVTIVGNSVSENDTTKTKSSNRSYPLLPDIKDILLKIKRQQNKNVASLGDCYFCSDYIFTKKDGTLYYPSYPSHALPDVIKKNDLTPIRWHDLRHSCASMLILKGWSMKDISDWLGHSGIGITMDLYTHLDMAHKKEMGQKLADLFVR